METTEICIEMGSSKTVPSVIIIISIDKMKSIKIADLTFLPPKQKSLFLKFPLDPRLFFCY